MESDYRSNPNNTSFLTKAAVCIGHDGSRCVIWLLIIFLEGIPQGCGGALRGLSEAPLLDVMELEVIIES